MISYTPDIDQSLRKFIGDGDFDKVIILCDNNTFSLVQNFAEDSPLRANNIIIPAGEQHKNLSTAQFIWEELKLRGTSRKSLLVNFGGGMVSDIGGFCAATYMRGIRLANIPTSLLSMVDAAVGGKNGINFSNTKNAIGTFHHPEVVFIHLPFLQSLPNDEMKSGWGEVIKHGIIHGGFLWEQAQKGIPNSTETAVWQKIIEESNYIKSRIVSEDPEEKGLRKILNLGHTFGHALESTFMANGEYLSHGHAVAIGLILESNLSHILGKTSNSLILDVRSAVQRTFEIPIIPDAWLPQIIQAMQSDKKANAGELHFALPIEIGNVVQAVKVSEVQVSEAFAEYQKYAASISSR